MPRSPFLLLALVLAAYPARAQLPAWDGVFADSLLPLAVPGSEVEDRARLETLLDRETTTYSLLRAPSSALRLGARRIALLRPELRTVVNSSIPLSMNDGGMWAGRGATMQVVGGGVFRVGPVTGVFAPELTWVQNLDFDLLESRDPTRSRMLPPWRVGDSSADLPLRFGDGSYALLDLGQSSLRLDAGPLAVGLSTESQWWGPGVRNAIVLSNNAPGIPHLYLNARTGEGNRFGSVDAKWLVGGLTESLYFDNDPGNQLRSLSGLGVSFTPRGAPDLTLGLARTVYAPVDNAGAIASRAADVFTRWSRPDSAGDERYEQITSVFGRWVFPVSGLELYGEWARNELPSDLRDFLVAPHHTQGYTLGLQWARQLAERGQVIRVQTEASFLERSATYRIRETPSYYASRLIPQGYTHRGQVVGAAIGPGGSSQWAAADWLGDERSIGGYVMRIRWDNDAFYSRPNGDRWYGHDLSMIFGVRGHTGWRGMTLRGDLALEERFNFLYQNTGYIWGDEFATDVHNLHLRLTISPD